MIALRTYYHNVVESLIDVVSSAYGAWESVITSLGVSYGDSLISFTVISGLSVVYFFDGFNIKEKES